MSLPATDQELKDRAEKVYRYYLRGIKAPEIGRLEGLPRSTVYWLLQEGSRILGGELRMITKASLLQDLFLEHHERKREIWMDYSAARSVKDKMTCIQRLVEESRLALELAERMGIIERKAETAEQKDGINVHVQTYVTQLLRLPTDALASYVERERAHLFGGERGAAATNGH